MLVVFSYFIIYTVKVKVLIQVTGYNIFFTMYKYLNFLFLIVAGVKPLPGFENLPRSFWHELSSPFTEVSSIFIYLIRLF